MKKLIPLFVLMCSCAWAQTTTTITGTIRDLSQALVTSGKVTFTLTPNRDTTISGTARFTPTTIACLINASGLIKAQDGVSVCTLTMNTALQPTGTYYTVALWPYNVKTSTFTFYAVLSTYDWSTVVPTPATSPAQNYVDIFSNQSIGGNKTVTGAWTFGGPVAFGAGSLNTPITPAVLAGVYIPTQCGTLPAPSWCAGADLGAWINAAYAALPATGGAISVPSGSYSYTTPIVFNGNHKIVALSGTGNGSTTLVYTASTGIAITVDTGASQFSSILSGFKLIGPGNGTSTTGIAWGSVTNGGSTVAGASNITVAAFGLGINHSFGAAWGFSGNRVQVFDNGQNLLDTSGHENMRYSDSVFAVNLPGTSGTVVNSVQISGSSDYSFFGTSFDNTQLACSSNAICRVFGGHFENPSNGSYDFFVSSGMDMELHGVEFLQDNVSSFPNNRIGSASAGAFQFHGGTVFSPITLTAVLGVSGSVCASDHGLLLDSFFSNGWVTGSTSGCTVGLPQDAVGSIVTNGVVQANTMRTFNLFATGIADGQAPVTRTTASACTIGTTSAGCPYAQAYLSGYSDNQDATAGQAVTYTLPTAATGLQQCVDNSYNGSAPDTGILTIATSAAGQFIIFTDGTLSATGGTVTSSGAAGDAACMRGVDATHWQFTSVRGVWTKH